MDDESFHLKMLNSILAEANISDDDKEFIGNFIADKVNEQDATTIAYRSLCSISAFLDSQGFLTGIQRAVLVKLVEDLWSRIDRAGPVLAIEDAPAPVGNDETGNKEDGMSTSKACDEQEAQDLQEFLDFQGAQEAKDAQAAQDARGTQDAQAVASSATTPRNDGGADILAQGINDVSLNDNAPTPGFVKEKEAYQPKPVNFHAHTVDAGKGTSPTKSVFRLGQELKQAYPFAHRLMKEQGWTPGRGLGPDGTGIQKPIDAHSLAGIDKTIVAADGVGHSGRKAAEDHNAVARDDEQRLDYHLSHLRDYMFPTVESPPRRVSAPARSAAPTAPVKGSEMTMQSAQSHQTGQAQGGTGPTAWSQYTKDPRAGDASAKPGYAPKGGPVGDNVVTGGPVFTEKSRDTSVPVQSPGPKYPTGRGVRLSPHRSAESSQAVNGRGGTVVNKKAGGRKGKMKQPERGTQQHGYSYTINEAADSRYSSRVFRGYNVPNRKLNDFGDEIPGTEYWDEPQEQPVWATYSNETNPLRTETETEHHRTETEALPTETGPLPTETKPDTTGHLRWDRGW
ncbi:Uu.00g041870.m01.CDS01 [Anthostomella pinea]|uniref:Uu.00g041870.m01.CDS01 n=1 Tax=Anthostomella pinea TaxID=933095 RepID=A0AAI8VAF6_9PEZI|nr:Uu.00g041870.m01.CDS01 [Anthostomella pinea]